MKTKIQYKNYRGWQDCILNGNLVTDLETALYWQKSYNAWLGCEFRVVPQKTKLIISKKNKGIINSGISESVLLKVKQSYESVYGNIWDTQFDIIDAN